MPRTLTRRIAATLLLAALSLGQAAVLAQGRAQPAAYVPPREWSATSAALPAPRRVERRCRDAGTSLIGAVAGGLLGASNRRDGRNPVASPHALAGRAGDRGC